MRSAVGQANPLLTLKNCTKLYRDSPFCPFCPFYPIIESATYAFSIGRVSSNPTRVFRCYVHVLKAKQIRYSDALADRYGLSLVQAQTMNGVNSPAAGPQCPLSRSDNVCEQLFLGSNLVTPCQRGSCFSGTKVNLIGSVNSLLAHLTAQVLRIKPELTDRTSHTLLKWWA
jgi:hypothetical protein